MNLLLRLISASFGVITLVAVALFSQAVFVPHGENWLLPHYGDIEPWMHKVFYAMAAGALAAGAIMLRQRQGFWGSCVAMMGLVGFIFALLGFTPVNGPAVQGPIDQIVFETAMMSFVCFLAFATSWPTKTPKPAPCFG